MMKMSVLYIVGVLLLASCSSRPLPTNMVEVTRTSPITATAIKYSSLPTEESTKTPTLTSQLTQTATPSPTLSSSDPTLTLLPITRLTTQCLDIASNLPANSNVQGTLVLNPAYPDNASQIYLWDMETGEKQPLLKDGESTLSAVVSPSGKWLAYQWGTAQGSELNWLIIVTADGKRHTAIPDEWGWYRISHWLDDHRLIILGERENIISEQLVLDPFTEERQDLPPLPMDLNSLIRNPSEGMMISYDPTLTYRLYPNENYETILEDLNSQEILAHFLTVWEAIPRWSPDGQHFILVTYILLDTGPAEAGLYSIDLQGNMQKLTDLAIERTSYTWSPDGRHIAFWLIDDPKNNNRVSLGVLDTETLDVVNYCVTTEHISKFPPPITWSPNSQQLIMEIADMKDDNLVRAVIVDITQGWAAQITKDMTPIGWMVNP